MCSLWCNSTPIMNILKYFGDEMKNDMVKVINGSEKRKIAYIDETI